MKNYQLCYFTIIRVLQWAQSDKSLQSFLDHLRDLIQEVIDCEGVAILLAGQDDQAINLISTTGTEWTVPIREQTYQKGEYITGEVWERNTPLITNDLPEEWKVKEKSFETVSNKDDYVYLWMPISDFNERKMGIIRCRNKRVDSKAETLNTFTDDDVFLLSAIVQASMPLIQFFQKEERRSRGLARLSHEIRVPLVAIRGATELMMQTKGVDDFFDHDYLGDVWSWSELMRRLIGNADFLNPNFAVGLPIQPTPASLLADVIAPAVQQARLLLNERNFSRRNINYDDFSNIPKLWVDRNQLQQVVFNLLSNAIKHCYSDPDSFTIEITSSKIQNNFLIRFRDWGPGIQDDEMGILFKEGGRSPNAIARNITGYGLGLWVVRKIVEAHDGRVELTNQRHPTEFTIYLPTYLEKSPPSQFRQKFR